MKKFLQTPWGAAVITAVFFLTIMGGVAVMAKSMFNDHFEEATKAKQEKALPAKKKSLSLKQPSIPKGGKPDPAKSKAESAEPKTAPTKSTEPTEPSKPNAEPTKSKSEPGKPETETPAAKQVTNAPTNEKPSPGDSERQPVTQPGQTPNPAKTNTDTIEQYRIKAMEAEQALSKARIRQSPIDISPENALPLPTLKPIEFHYTQGLHTLLDTGHTIRVNVNKDENHILIDGKKYQLEQFHFHAQSEHTISGKATKMEVHLVHVLAQDKSDTEETPCVTAPQSSPFSPSRTTPTEEYEQTKPTPQYAVIGILIKQGDEEHPFIQDLWTGLDEVKPMDTGIRFRLDGPMSLLPPEGKRSYYRYNGSLTTAPFSETVLWTVMAEPIQFSAAQIKAYTDLYPDNFRKKQLQHQRFVLKYEDKPAETELTAEPENTTPPILDPKIEPIQQDPLLETPPESLPEPNPSTNPELPINAPNIGVRGGIGLPGVITTPQSPLPH